MNLLTLLPLASVPFAILRPFLARPMLLTLKPTFLPAFGENPVVVSPTFRVPALAGVVRRGVALRDPVRFAPEAFALGISSTSPQNVFSSSVNASPMNSTFRSSMEIRAVPPCPHPEPHEFCIRTNGGP